ncbi:YeeE/YedE thiosulfate transporter family protein [Stenotrophomonas sp. SY1]|uniref:YeeE/YedE family protein n=1 Tax=Stenotrophomonas sp. SY1 TaxID=477235 RepID=UPI001E4E2656|nr:YeeE/YedE thiosulfate transporter family protein [Stenotrophomonas sp. SY1]MCD9087779.1 YeeE/YedE family protein [Stenotrophomonas sp. SY1]
MSSWMSALAGGVLIGLAATLLLWLTGRIAGISGILGGVIMPSKGEWGWRVAFLVGLIGAGAAWLWWVPGAFVPRQGFPPLLLVVAGLLVGFGTRMSNGCTSGHGVCGLGRLSPRSMVAVMVFMATAIATTYIVRHVA